MVKLMSLAPGTRVRVEQHIDHREGTWEHIVEGVVREVRPEPTGSWFAHGKHGRLWLHRLELEKDDGEITTLVVDHRTRVTVLPSPEPSATS